MKPTIMKKIGLTIVTVCFLTGLFAQPPAAQTRHLPAKRTIQPVKIDGLINEDAWKDAAEISDFTEFRPKVGAKENEESKTIAYLMYASDGFYFGGHCYERTRDSITAELKGRDGFGNNDFVGLIIDTYKDHLNGFEYFVTPLGEQWDSKVSPGNSDNGGEDFTWNAVWESATVIHDNGWSFEMFIPYSAIRFAKNDVQDWGLNITRRRQKTGQQYMWNAIDPNKNGFLTQEGYWTGITNIKPPLRLQFSPYFSVYANHYPLNQPGEKNLKGQVNGGLDLKYGINQAFTLDATLIPDFGQVQSDNQVLNLTPFEVQFNENRAFFTEGTELFGKGNLFYSRRIGGQPLRLYDVYNQLGADEKVLKNPTESKLINASKISGRTENGLGIGILNAITKPQYAIIENMATKTERQIETDPLTNYNILVLDQTLKHNSSVSFINTNVWRSGHDYDANVSAVLFDFNDKKNTYNIGGKAAVSHLTGFPQADNSITGYSHNVYMGKTSGKFNFRIYQDLTDKKYNHRDLGYFTNNNFIDHGGFFGLNLLEPKGWYNRISMNVNGSVSKLFKPFDGIEQTFQRASVNYNLNIQAKTLWWYGAYVGYDFKSNDFYEPRSEGKFFRKGSSLAVGTWVESNFAKKYFFFTEAFARRSFNFYNQFGIDFTFGQTYRFNSRFSVSHRLNLRPRYNNIGYASASGAETIFSKRRINTTESTFDLKYNFNNKMGITFRSRHYMSTVANREFFTLLQDGNLAENNTFNQPVDRNVNFFNIDMVYTWQFAPGSFINVVWKNAIVDQGNAVEENYFKNLGQTLDADQNNNLSFKIIYFLDYLKLKKVKSKG